MITQFHDYLLSSGLLDVLQFLEDAFGGKLQNPSTFTDSLERVIVIGVTLDFTGLGDLSSNLWSNSCGILAFESFRVLVCSTMSKTKKLLSYLSYNIPLGSV